MTQHGPGVARSIAGRYAFVPNPCTTRPCLPGMAWAVQAQDAPYFLTVQGRWFAQERSWNGYTPAAGDAVTVTGSVEQRLDVDGRPYLCIEVGAVVPG